ncbi:MAG TPA: hypothetical protein VMK65_10530 [Longimicrobiales bacterium]|nr:hypothetical protein [Longimicrobiales bacterium]
MMPSSSAPTRALLTLLAAAPLAACGDAAAGGDGDTWQAVHDTLGDTVVVRTVAGSVWGDTAQLVPELTIGEFEGADAYMFGQVQSMTVSRDGHIYLYDGHAKALRKYTPDGTYVATFGREGGGPGEYKRPDGGLRALPDGRVVLRDPGNARINVYSSEGEPLGSWPIRGGFSTSRQLAMDTAGRVYHQVLLDPSAGLSEWKSGLLVFSPEGEELDTLSVPDTGFEAPVIEARTENSWSRNTVPFSPGEEWQLHPHGYFIHAISTRYALDLLRPEGVLRIARDVEPVGVDPAEKANAEARSTHNMRRMIPDWKWNGPPIPDTKPPWRSFQVGEEGRIWVVRSQPGERVPDDQIEESRDPDAAPPNRWREPVVFDVYEPDGTYLGAVRAPEGFSLYPTPIFRGDRVWGIVRDALDVQYVTRLRVDRGAAQLERRERGE